MKKKEITKLKLNALSVTFCIISILLYAVLFLCIERLTKYIVYKNSMTIAYRVTASYAFILLGFAFIAIDFLFFYNRIKEKIPPSKKQNQKIPSHKKHDKGEKSLRNIKNCRKGKK